MKSRSVKITSMILALAMLTISVFTSIANASGFSDLKPTHWCYEKIMNFLDRGFVCGYEDGTFKPDRTITRAEYVKIVNNFFGYSENENIEKLTFSDVSKKDWFAGYVAEAVERGYITGYPDGTFRPNEPIRRQEATVILSRILNIDEEVYPEDHIDGLAQYSDGKVIEEWAYVAIHSYSVYNFINGYPDGTIKLLQNVTRAETVELLHILEQKIEIEEDKKPGGGGSSTKVQKVKTPVINAYEMIEKVKTPVEGWVNAATSQFEKGNGSLVEISCPTNGATIYYSVDGNAKKEYKESFILPDGKYKVEAWAEKQYMSDSSKATKYVNVDTVPPVVYGIDKETSVLVNVEDYNFYGIKENELSGVNEESLKYAWFIYDEKTGDYVRETAWEGFINNTEVQAPEYPGIYYLGIMGSDKAENEVGTGGYQKNSNIDDKVDFPNDSVSGDEITNDPFVIVTEIEKVEDIPSGDSNVSGDNSETPSGDEKKEEVIDIVVKATVKVIHRFDDLPSGDIIEYVKANPGSEFTPEELNSKDYPFVENYDLDKNSLNGIIVSRNSEENEIVVKYTRIKIEVSFKGSEDNDNEVSGGPMDNLIVLAGTSETLPENEFEKIGHTFIGWSGDNGIFYESGDTFGDKGENVKDREVTLVAVWEPLSYNLVLVSGDNISEVVGAGNYKYGEVVEIDALLAEVTSGESFDYDFAKWIGDIDKIEDEDFDETEKDSSFKMPASDLVLEATANIVDVDIVDFEMKTFEGKDKETKPAPEPGDKISYSAKLYNAQNNDITVNINIDAPSGDVMDIEIGGKKYKNGDEVTIPAGKKLEITFNVESNEKQTPINEMFDVTITANSQNGKLLDEELEQVKTEKTLAINYKQRKDKNIVMLIDLSGSMGFCTDSNHPMKTSNEKIYKGNDVRYKNYLSGDYSGDFVGSYDEGMDVLFDENGNMILDYTQDTEQPWANHKYADKEGMCTKPARIDAVIQALINDNGFIDTVSEAAKKNGEKVTITLVTFSGYKDNEDSDENVLAQIVKSCDINDSNLEKVIEDLKFDIHDGTRVNTGLEQVLEATKSLSSGDDIENHFIFFGDGKADDNTSEELLTRKGLLAKILPFFDYSYAIGFGADFDVTENYNLLKSMLIDEDATPIKAEKAEDITAAFKDIALAISTTAQTKNGVLELKGKSFEDAVNKDEVFPIALLDDKGVLFKIIDETTTSPISWPKENPVYETTFKINKTDDKITSIEIDLSGTTFSDKKNLKVMLNYTK